MTTPKSPARPPVPPLKPEAGPLDDSIKELEILITDKAEVSPRQTGNTGVPVLDDIIEPDDTDYIDDMEQLLQQEQPAESPTQQEHISRDELEYIINNVEEKLASELDALVNILKDTIKDSIMSEIKTQLESGLNKTRTETSDDEPT